MNQFIAPDANDCAHHRNHFTPAVRAALGLLDRVSEGQSVPRYAIDHALSLTGDIEVRRASYRSWREQRCAIVRDGSQRVVSRAG